MTKKEDAAVLTNKFTLWFVSCSFLSFFLGFTWVFLSKDASKDPAITDELSLSVKKVANHPPSIERTDYLKYANKMVSQDGFNRWQWVRLGNMYDEVIEAEQEADYAKQKAKLIRQTANALKE